MLTEAYNKSQPEATSDCHDPIRFSRQRHLGRERETERFMRVHKYIYIYAHKESLVTSSNELASTSPKFFRSARNKRLPNSMRQFNQDPCRSKLEDASPKSTDSWPCSDYMSCARLELLYESEDAYNSNPIQSYASLPFQSFATARHDWACCSVSGQEPSHLQGPSMQMQANF